MVASLVTRAWGVARCIREADCGHGGMMELIGMARRDMSDERPTTGAFCPRDDICR